jgi:CubicO group peptidase (beta-lactamase class C family)
MSTAHDYWKFCQMLLNGGSFEGVRLLKPETVDLLRGDLLPDGITEIAWGSKGIGFGMNFAVVHTPDERPSKSRAGEYYWAGLANSLFFIDPNEGLVGVLMVSLMPPNVHPFQEDMRNLVYGASEQ